MISMTNKTTNATIWQDLWGTRNHE